MPSPAVNKVLFGGPTPNAQAKAFLAAAGDMSSMNRKAYIKLINGLVSDGDWANLDSVFAYAAPNSTTSLLDLKLNGTTTLTNTPTFVTNRGWQNSGTNSLSLSVPITKFSRFDGAYGAWEFTNRSSDVDTIYKQSGVSLIVPFSGGNSTVRMNCASGGATWAQSTSYGLFQCERLDNVTTVGYYNGVQQATDATVTSFGPSSPQTPILIDSSSFGVAFWYMGSGTGTDATRIYNRLRTYATDIGMP